MTAPTASWPPCRRWWAAVAAWSVLAAQAGVSTGGSADPPPAMRGAGSPTLDKALGGDLTTGDRNLDLLLDAQRKAGDRLDETPASRPVPGRPAGNRQGLQPLPEAASAAPAPLPPPDARTRFEPSLALPERGQLANPGLATPKVARDWGGGSGQATSGGGSSGAGDGSGGGSIYGDTTQLRSAARPLREWIQAALALVTDHLITLALVGAAIALLAVGIKAYSRRL